ncbi:hypothetical protein [Chelativorans sp. J32]|mgnify:CR=1 FL=1|uniref:hypothetical protein n=1 Tax=Chelativorans sp. J32 TaxID=935840 RepID=UPI0004885763|nr:hypothetical protein [Chelativorans sp. J32]
MERLVYGALAGLSATTVMTAAMRHLWSGLGAEKRYPLPPREIIEQVKPTGGEGASRLQTILAHFGFGALAGAMYAVWPERRPNGVIYGLGVWAGSYLGWIPALSILKPATRHPAERNLLMLAVHVVWGAALAMSLREIEGASRDVFAGGQPADADHGFTRRRLV